MHTEVDQRSAAGLFLVIEPRSHRCAGTCIEAVRRHARNAAAAEPDTPRVVNITEHALPDHVFHRAGLRVEPVGKVDAEFFPETFCSVQHLLRLLRVERHRFLAQDMRAGFQSGNGQGLVLVVGNGDGDDVELFLFDHLRAFVIDFAFE